MMLIDEHFDGDGAARKTWLALVEPAAVGGADGSASAAPAALDAEARLRLIAPDGEGELPQRALAVVMQRYGRPLADGVSDDAIAGPALTLPGGARLTRMRWRAMVDAAGRDYLVLEVPERPPLAALASPVAAALRHLARRAQVAPE